MKTARILVISGAIVTALAVGLFALLNIADTQPPMSFEEFAADSGSVDLAGEGRPGLYVTDLIEPGRGDHILEDVRAGRINLLSELRRLRSYCDEDAPAGECDALVIDFLNRLPEPDGGKLVELFENYRSYESQRATGRLAGEAAGLNTAERYARIRELRRKIFGEEDAALVFGLEEAHLDFQAVVRRFAGDAKELAGLSATERMAEFEAARAEVFGPYYATLREREPADTRLGIEMLVRQNELEQMPDGERRDALHALRTRHLGAERADAILAQEEAALAEAARNNARLEGFLQAEQEFLTANPDLPVAERLAKIEELRTQYYADD
ncbi:MAG: lipase chaperone [bacterium]|nr:lipase chaperone [bacterium]